MNVPVFYNNYASTTNPTQCTLSYELLDSKGIMYSSSSSPVKIDKYGDVFIS